MFRLPACDSVVDSTAFGIRALYRPHPGRTTPYRVRGADGTAISLPHFNRTQTIATAMLHTASNDAHAGHAGDEAVTTGVLAANGAINLSNSLDKGMTAIPLRRPRSPDFARRATLSRNP
jgi:hypothetical protein